MAGAKLVNVAKRKMLYMLSVTV